MKSLSLNQPHLLIMVGIPGSGKSFFAEKFSDMFHAPYVEHEAIMALTDQNSGLSAKYTAYLLRELLKTNHTIVIDGLADSRAERAELRQLAHAAGYKPLFIWVQTDEATAKYRTLKASKHDRRPISADEYDSLVQRFTAPTPNEQPVIVISGKHTYATQAKVVLKNLAAAKHSTRASQPSHERHAPTTPPPSAGTKRNITIL